MRKPIRRPCGQSADQQRLRRGLDLADPGEMPLDRSEAEQGRAGGRDRDLQGRTDVFGEHVGTSGIKPPTTYEPPIVTALIGARFGSGRSNPSSKRIMKSTQRCLSDAMALTTEFNASP